METNGKGVCSNVAKWFWKKIEPSQNTLKRNFDRAMSFKFNQFFSKIGCPTLKFYFYSFLILLLWWVIKAKMVVRVKDKR